MVSEEKNTEPPLLKKLTELIEPVVEDFGLELVELQFRREAPGWVLRLIIDSEVGVSIDDCANVSREVGHLLEVEDLIEQAYTLEVSSPGLDRPLKKEKDFVRCKGKKAKVVVHQTIAGQNAFVGVIEGFQAGNIVLATEQGTVDIPFTTVKKARLVVEF
ncbi:ribosome maturation factor RimP [Thiovibrio sp. JS02]